jgi:hypothetical protein
MSQTASEPTSGPDAVSRWRLAGWSPGGFLLHVFSPIALGAFIYLTWRTTRLKAFGWFESWGLRDVIVWLRTTFNGVDESLPEWVLYALPDGLWCYAATAFFARQWADSDTRWAWAWTLLAPALGCGGEVGQAIGIVPGTYDWWDFGLSALGAVLAIYFGRYWPKRG